MRGTPAAIVAKVNADLVQVLSDPATASSDRRGRRACRARRGRSAISSRPRSGKWREVIRKADIRVE